MLFEVTPEEAWKAFMAWNSLAGMSKTAWWEISGGVIAFHSKPQTVTEEHLRRIRAMGGPYGHAIIKAYLARTNHV